MSGWLPRGFDGSLQVFFMKRRKIILWIVCVVALLFFWGAGAGRGRTPRSGVGEIRMAPFEVWSIYEGSLEARRLENVMSQLAGSATIVELVAEGASVKKGDLLVRFDSSQLERDLLKLERDDALAKADLDGLENAKLPLELRDLETKLRDAQSQRDAESQYLEDSRQLLAEELISEQEVKQQELKTMAASALVESIDVQLDLTRKHLHPSILERARATLNSADQELKIARQQLQKCTVLSQVDGMVVYQPAHVAGEYRTVRVGDTIYRNQPFLALPDMTDPVVRCEIPESELSRVKTGNEVRIVPVSYPDLSLNGVVEYVGSMAQNARGRSGWLRYFHVVIGLKDVDPRLRSGMSVRVRVLTYRQPQALQIPRAAVDWDQGVPSCEVVRFGRKVRRDLKLGMANEQYFEVLSGVDDGDSVVLR